MKRIFRARHTVYGILGATPPRHFLLLQRRKTSLKALLRQRQTIHLPQSFLNPYNVPKCNVKQSILAHHGLK